MTIRYNPPTCWPQAGRPFHHGVIEPEGRVLHMTGQVAWDANGETIGVGDCETQTRQCYEYVKDILTATGGKLEDIVSLTTYFVDPSDIPTIQKVRAEYLAPETGPASIFIQVAGLISPYLLVEVVPIAVIPEARFISPELDNKEI